MTIDDIRAIVWVGNYHSDHGRFHAIEDFVLHSGAPYAEKYEAFVIYGRDGMGLGPEHCTPAIYDEWLADLEDRV